MPPVPGESSPARPPVPRDVRISFWIWLASVVASIVSGFLVIADEEALKAQVIAANQNSGLSPEDLRRVADLSFTLGVVLFFGIALLLVLFVFLMRAGRNWARVVLAALAALRLFGLAVAVGTTDLVSLGFVVLAAAALVFMFTPMSNAYFREVKRSR